MGAEHWLRFLIWNGDGGSTWLGCLPEVSLRLQCDWQHCVPNTKTPLQNAGAFHQNPWFHLNKIKLICGGCEK